MLELGLHKVALQAAEGTVVKRQTFVGLAAEVLARRRAVRRMGWARQVQLQPQDQALQTLSAEVENRGLLGVPD